MLKQLSILVNYSQKEYIVKQIPCFTILLINTLLSLIYPLFITLIIDVGVKEKSFTKVIFFSICMLAIGLLSVMFSFIEQISFVKLGKK